MPVEIYVEDGEIEILGLGHFGRFIDAARHADQLITEVGEHILQQHADQEFVLDHKDSAPSLRGSWVCGVHESVIPVSRTGRDGGGNIAGLQPAARAAACSS